MLERILAGDTRVVARAATLIESRLSGWEALLRSLFPHSGRALTIGITGPPGAGKSTLVDQFATELRKQGRRVGIIAVDPSSPFTGGAILGDRVRMSRHYADPGVFIRSMASRGRLGGLAPATADLGLLLDAAGFEMIFIETLGAGQDEVDVARIADVTVVVLAPGFGDDIQAIKAGIMEIADIFLINKADLPGASRVEKEVLAALALGPPQSVKPAVIRCVATDPATIPGALNAIENARRQDRDPAAVWTGRLREMLRERILERLPVKEIESAAAEVAAKRIDPYSVVSDWIERLSH